MRILEEFWYGNIEPTEYDTWSTPYMFMHRTNPADTECRM